VQQQVISLISGIIIINGSIGKTHMDKYKEIINDWNYDASCALKSLLVSDLENF
jgi:hypothetical protein